MGYSIAHLKNLWYRTIPVIFSINAYSIPKGIQRVYSKILRGKVMLFHFRFHKENGSTITILQILESRNLCSVANLGPTLCNTHAWQHTRLLCLALSPWVCSNVCPLSQWCHQPISSSVTPFSSCPQYFPASGSFPMSQLFASGGWSIEASASILPMNIQGWFPLGLNGLISFLFKGLSRVFSNTTVQKHQFFSIQASLWSRSYIHAWLLEK